MPKEAVLWPGAHAGRLEIVQPLWHDHDQTALNFSRSNSAEKPGGYAPRKGPGLRALAFGLVLLGVCVFAWGLRYKLSLYDPPHAISRHMPEAKLVTGKQRGPLASVNLRSSGNAGSALALSTFALAFFVLLGVKMWPGVLYWASGFQGLRLAPQCDAAMACFIRPPPCLL